MKKLLSILCLSIIVLTAASCKKETVYVKNDNFTKVIPVQSADWGVYKSNALTVDLDVPELDNAYNEKGAVLVYIAYGADAPWEQVPETFGGQSFSFTHNPGTVSLYVQNPNGVGVPNTPDPIYVKIVLIDSHD